MEHLTACECVCIHSVCVYKIKRKIKHLRQRGREKIETKEMGGGSHIEFKPDSHVHMGQSTLAYSSHQKETQLLSQFRIIKLLTDR